MQDVQLEADVLRFPELTRPLSCSVLNSLAYI